jgi:hypothetical protein
MRICETSGHCRFVTTSHENSAENFQKLLNRTKIEFLPSAHDFVVSTHTSIFSKPEKIILKLKFSNENFRKNYTFAETLKYAILASSSSGARS